MILRAFYLSQYLLIKGKENVPYFNFLACEALEFIYILKCQ